MKTKEELDAVKEEYEDVNAKYAELTDEGLEQVTGGANNEPLVTFTGKYLNDGSHNAKITPTETVLYSETKPEEDEN